MLKTLCKYLYILVIILMAAFISPAGAWADNAERLDQIKEMYEEYKASFPKAPDISPQKALELWKAGQVQFVDVREPKEMEVSMLPGAVTWEQYRNDPGKYADKKVVLYCTIGYRSGKAVEELQEENISNVYNLAQSLLGWVHAGGPVFKDGKEVKRIHVYGKKWDLAPEGIEGVYKKGWLW